MLRMRDLAHPPQELCAPQRRRGKGRSRGGAGKGRGRSPKRARTAPPAVDECLELVVTYPSPLDAALFVSLPASVRPQRLDGTPLQLGTLHRPQLPRDETPNLPAAMGPSVRFVTLAVHVPAGAAVSVCRACDTADDRAAHPGFVYIVGRPPASHPR